MITTVKGKGDEQSITASVRVVDNVLWSRMTNPWTKKSGKQNIVSLTETEFVLEDEQGQLIKLERPKRE